MSRLCNYPNCYAVIEEGRYCESHTRPKKQDRRPSAAARGYDHKWHEFSKGFLKRHPVCGCGKPATITGHDIPIQIMREMYGGNVYDDALYHPSCPSCNGKEYHRKDKKMLEEFQQHPGAGNFLEKGREE